MPPKKSGLGRGSRGGKKAKQKRRSAVETGGAAERREDLEREIQRLQQRLADAEQQLEENQQGVGAVWAGLTGTHRRRSSIASAEAGSSEGDGDDGESDEEAGGQRAPKRRRLTIETIEQRTVRLASELEVAGNSPGRSRTYEENRTFVFACLKAEQEVLQRCEEHERPHLQNIARQVASGWGTTLRSARSS